jgi:hypothetical protein
MNSLNTRHAQFRHVCMLHQHQLPLLGSRWVRDHRYRQGTHAHLRIRGGHCSTYAGTRLSAQLKVYDQSRDPEVYRPALRYTNLHLAAGCGAEQQAITGLGSLMLVNLRLVTYTAIRKDGVRSPVSSLPLFQGLWLQGLRFGCSATKLARRSLCSRLLE